MQTITLTITPTRPLNSNMGKDNKRIFKYIKQWNRAGATCDEVCHSLKIPHQTASARFTELKRWGFIAWSGATRLTQRGRPAKVYVTTEV